MYTFGVADNCMFLISPKTAINAVVQKFIKVDTQNMSSQSFGSGDLLLTHNTVPVVVKFMVCILVILQLIIICKQFFTGTMEGGQFWFDLSGFSRLLGWFSFFNWWNTGLFFRGVGMNSLFKLWPTDFVTSMAQVIVTENVLSSVESFKLEQMLAALTRVSNTWSTPSLKLGILGLVHGKWSTPLCTLKM